MDNETHDAGMDRRKLIKRAGVLTAGVAAWSTPMVSSLASSAHATGSAPPKCQSCGDFPQCGSSSNSIDGLCYCYNSGDDPNECVCAINTFCNDLDRCPGGQSDCDSGFACVSAANGCGEPVCIPSCDNPGPARRMMKAGSGKTTVPSQ